MRANGHTMLQGQAHGPAHDARVARVITTGDIGAVDVGHDLGIQTHAPVAVTFTHVAVEKQGLHLADS
ncbi:hypothetical protein D3C78_1785790 [compost metagenome]